MQNKLSPAPTVWNKETVVLNVCSLSLIPTCRPLTHLLSHSLLLNSSEFRNTKVPKIYQRCLSNTKSPACSKCLWQICGETSSCLRANESNWDHFFSKVIWRRFDSLSRRSNPPKLLLMYPSSAWCLPFEIIWSGRQKEEMLLQTPTWLRTWLLMFLWC